jgi:hypothetical protein
MKKILIALALCLLAVGLIASQASAFSFNSLTAIAYADTWWDGRNPAYHDYGSVDCANFVSQCLKAGGLNLSVPPYADNWGCIPSCDNLNAYLVNSLGVHYETWSQNDPLPSWFLPGDVAIFGDSSDHWRHSVFAVASDSNGNTLVDAHSNNRYHVPISFYFGGSSTFTLCNYYDVNINDPTLTPTILSLNNATAARGKPATVIATLTETPSTGSGPLSGKTITLYIQQKVKNGVTWVAVGSSQSGSYGTATFLIPAKLITMQQQPIKAVFVGDGTYSDSVGTALIIRQ